MEQLYIELGLELVRGYRVKVYKYRREQMDFVWMIALK